jgi:hypothetical protein
VPALDRALALEAVDRVAVLVGEDLHFDVAGRRKVALDQQRAVAECRLRLPRRGGERVFELGRAVHDAHAAAAAARGCFDQQWIAERVRVRAQRLARE